ncbi:MAG: twin-arginine translocation signal domain-containing protein [Rhizobiales bacterium]|nr:twin-arginine translocation signal domain-containing protein [Hyphomicrobiales bacterium]
MVSRRQFLVGGAAVGAASLSLFATSKPLSALTTKPNYILEAQQAKWRFNGALNQSVNVYTYQKNSAIPLLRMQQGTPFKALLKNSLNEPTTNH